MMILHVKTEPGLKSQINSILNNIIRWAEATDNFCDTVFAAMQ